MNTSRFPPTLLAALLLTATARAATLPASEDTSSFNGKFALPASKATTLPVDTTHRAYIAFNLADVPATSAAQIRYARLRLYFPTVIKAGGGLDIRIVTSVWNEAVASPEPTFAPGSTAVIAANALGSKRFASVDVTGAVKGWITSQASDEGFAILPVGTVTKLLIGAKEGSGSGYPAELEIELADDPIAPGSITATELSAGAVGNTQLAPNLILAGTTSGSFSGDGSLLTSLSAANIVGQFAGAQIANGIVTTAKLVDGAVTTAKLAAGAVTTVELADGSVSLTDLAMNSVDSSKVAAGAITAAKLAGDVGLWSVSGSNVFRNSGNVGIGTTTPLTALHVAGTVTALGVSAESISFASPITRNIAIPAAAFAPANSQSSKWISDGVRFYPAAFPGGGAVKFVAPVTFPDGASVSSLHARVLDNSAAGNITITLASVAADDLLNEIATTGTSGPPSATVQTLNASVAHSVDNVNLRYCLVATWSDADTSNLDLRNVRLTYSISQPLP